jgi:transposase
LAQLGEPACQLPDALRVVLTEACLEIRGLEARARAVEKHLAALAKEMPVVQRLQSIPGIGPLTSTALVAFVGDAFRFATSRHFSSYLGLTPREHSSGLKRHLGSISKRGDTCLRTLLIHGARAVLFAAKRLDRPDRLRTWVLRVETLHGHNKAAVALANKLARIAWAVVDQGNLLRAPTPGSVIPRWKHYGPPPLICGESD